MPIVIPTVKEAAAVLGSQNTRYSTEALSSEKDVALVKLLHNEGADIEQRLDAALVLREREKEPAVVKRLFKSVQVSTRPTESDGTPGFTFAEKKTGILAAISLQGQISTLTDYVDLFGKWVEQYRYQLELQTRRKMQHSFRTGGNEEELPHEPKADAALEKAEHKFARAMVMLGSPRSDEAIGLLHEVLVYRSIDSDLKIFAVNALGGVNSPAAGETLGIALGFSTDTPILHTTILNVLSVYCPESEGLRKVLDAGREAASQGRLRSRLEGDLDAEASFALVERLYRNPLNPRFKLGEERAAQLFLAAESWRPILALHHPDSRLSYGGRGVLVETAPPGTNGDLLTVRRLTPSTL